MNRIQRALTKVRKQREQMIALRRKDTTLTAQSFRVEQVSRHAQYRSEAARERRSDVTILGAIDADIAVDDRFNADGGKLYRVNFVDPNRSVMTLAEAVVVE